MLKKIIALSVLLSVLLLSLSSCLVFTEDVANTTVYEQCYDSVGTVEVYDIAGNAFSLGTGFLYNGNVVTNYHVIENAYSAVFYSSQGTFQLINVIAYDKNIDLAILGLRSNGNLRSLNLFSGIIQTGETVYAIGASRGLHNTYSKGIITTAYRTIDNVVYVQHDASITNGNSGGPLLDQYGFVIGINTWGIQDSQNLNFAVHVSELSRLVYNKMTMQKFYEVTTDTPIIKSCNKLKKWITNNYTDSEENLLSFSEFFTDENAETTYAIIYDTEQKSLYIAGESYHKDGSKAMFGLRLYQDSVMCNYVGSYTDSEGQSNRCEGYVNCTTFYEGSTLTCEENSGGSWPEKKLMKYYTDCLLDCLGWFAVASEEYDMGISLYDLGFTHF